MRMGGGLGSADPVIIFRRSGGWRERCLQAGAVTATMRAASCRMGNPGRSQRDSEAGAMQTTPHCA